MRKSMATRGIRGIAFGLIIATASASSAQDIGAAKAKAIAAVEARAQLGQQLSDQIFSFAELGFEEVETSRLITSTLEKRGFKVRRGVSGLPTAWVATWVQGSGGPVIAIGSDLDSIPRASQKPGIPWHEPLVEGAPGHGEGHNSGVPLNIIAALAVKQVMEREKIPGTLMLWPGVAEELLAGKAFMVRDGFFSGVDAVLFTHVSDNLKTSWGMPQGTGLVSVEYTFKGEPSHAAGSPWRGRSALDAVTLMNLGWEMRREHLRPEQRSHYVISKGGDQPNVVPDEAKVWYYFREQSFETIRANYEIGNKIADAAAAMTDTQVTRQVIGSAAPLHFNRPMAEAAQRNIAAVGLPKWSSDDQEFAKALQLHAGVKDGEGLAVELANFGAPPAEPKSGGSDDIGDVSWVVPTININYPANVPKLPFHHWASASAMATPIAHKGIVAGAKVVAMTALDLLLDPKLRAAAKSYFDEVQGKEQKYQPMLSAADKPPVTMNAENMSRFRPAMRKYYYDPRRYRTYLDQLGVKFPTLTK